MFFNQITSLTLSQANAKYLQKATPDTASALETFSAGIKTDTINPTTTGTIQIGQAATNSNVEIAAQASRSTVLHLGDGDTSTGGIHIGNGLGSSNNVQILNGQYSAGQSAGTVNILSGTHNGVAGTGNCNLFTTAKGTLTIGGSNNANINFNKKPQFIAGTLSDTYDAYNPAVTMTLGSNLNVASSLTLGGLNPTTTINGSTSFPSGLKTTLIEGPDAVTNSTILNNLTTGTIQIGNGQTTGSLAICNGSSKSGTLGLARFTRGTVAIADSMTLTTGSVVIGTDSLGTVSMKGNIVNINTTGTGATNFGSSSSGSLTFYRPISPQYTISGTNGTGVGLVGEFKKVSNGFGYALIGGSASTIIFVDLTAGVWLLTGGMTTGSSGAGYNIISFSLVSNTLDLGLGAMNIPAYSGFTYNLSICNTFCLTASTRIFLVAQVATSDTWATPSITATRLA